MNSFNELTSKAAAHFLFSDITATENAILQAALSAIKPVQAQLLLSRLSLLLRYDQYDRLPGEINTFTADVYVRKEKTGGMPRTTSAPLPMPANKDLEEIVHFLNARLKQWEWRSLRNLLRGSRLMPDVTNIRILYQQELAVCKEMFSAGDLEAGLVAADFCRSFNDIQEAINWLTQTNQLAEKNSDLVGQANCQMMLGDWLSAPYSTPVVWNFAMESSSSQGGTLPTTVESIEFSPPTPENIAQARQAYENANSYLRKPITRWDWGRYSCGLATYPCWQKTLWPPLTLSNRQPKPFRKTATRRMPVWRKPTGSWPWSLKTGYQKRRVWPNPSATGAWSQAISLGRSAWACS